MANSRAQNLVQIRQRNNKSHETKQRDRPDQDKENNELLRLVLIIECRREMWTSTCLLPGPRPLYWMLQRRIRDDLDSVYTEVDDALRATLQGSFAENNFAVHLQK